MSAATPRVAQGASDGRRLGIAVGILILAVALLVGAAIVRQSGMLSTPAADRQVTVSVGGYTGIPYTPSRSLGAAAAGGYTGIPYTPTRQQDAAAGGYTGIPYTPSRSQDADGSGRTYAGQ